MPGLGRFPWRRAQQHIPVFLPGEFHGQRSLVGYSPWGRKELDTMEQLILLLLLFCWKDQDREIWSQALDLKGIRSPQYWRWVELWVLSLLPTLPFASVAPLPCLPCVGESILWLMLSALKWRKQYERLIHSEVMVDSDYCLCDLWIVNGDWRRQPVLYTEHRISDSKMLDKQRTNCLVSWLLCARSSPKDTDAFNQ